jgi:hypothetical protein
MARFLTRKTLLIRHYKKTMATEKNANVPSHCSALCTYIILILLQLNKFFQCLSDEPSVPCSHGFFGGILDTPLGNLSMS